MKLSCLQQSVTKRLKICVLVIFTIWLVIPAFELTVACLFTDIIESTCVPLGNIGSFAVMKTMLFITAFVEFILPLSLMIFCYARVVYTIRSKVTAS